MLENSKNLQEKTCYLGTVSIHLKNNKGGIYIPGRTCEYFYEHP